MKQYIIRSVKYFISLCVLCVGLMALMLVTGTSAMSLEETLSVMIYTDRFLMMVGVIVMLSALYPKFGFVVRQSEGEMVSNRTQIINAFKTAGFSLYKEREGVMWFRAEGFGRRLMYLFEDEISVSQSGQAIRIEGIRRAVAKINFRLESYIEMNKRNE